MTLSKFEIYPARELSGYAAQDAETLKQKFKGNRKALVATISRHNAFALLKPNSLSQIITAKNESGKPWSVYLMPAVQFFNNVTSRATDICMDNAVYGLSEGRGAKPLICVASFEDATAIATNLPSVDGFLQDRLEEIRQRQLLRPEKMTSGKRSPDVKLMETWGLEVYPRPEGLQTSLVSSGRTLVQYTPPEAANA